MRFAHDLKNRSLQILVPKPLWGLYDKKVIKDWVEEIRALPDGIVNDEYLYLHSDGRKWIGYKVGTYIVDEAMKKSGKTLK